MSTYEVQEKVFAKKLHQSLNAHGVKVRESRDSDNHPESNAICVFFDVTGSMGGSMQFSATLIDGTGPATYTQSTVTFASLPAVRITLSGAI